MDVTPDEVVRVMENHNVPQLIHDNNNAAEKNNAP
jgi:hypothetical protein